MRKFFIILIALGWLPCLLTLSQAHNAHEHGTAKVDIAVEGAQVSLGLESPLSNLLPFEHRPATPEQRMQVRDLALRLRRAETLFQLTPAAECRLTKAELESESLEPELLDPEATLFQDLAEDGGDKSPAKAGEHEEHGDLDAEFTFMCAKPEKLNSVDVLLFAAWPRIEKVEARAVTPRGQRADTLSAKKHLFSW